MKSPTAKTLPLRVNWRAEKSRLPAIAAMSGVSRSLVKALTTVAKAAPITTPTAMSTTLPRRRNCRNPLATGDSFPPRLIIEQQREEPCSAGKVKESGTESDDVAVDGIER